MIKVILDLVLGITYRIRGGGWVTWNNWSVRLVWSTSLALACYLESLSIVSISILLTAYASMYIPHACYQNMGRWATPQKSWPAFFLPTYTQAEWSALPQWKKTLNDFVGMAAVGFLRGLLIFAPFAYFINPFYALLALTIITVGQPIAYLLGFYIPVTIGSSLTKFSAQWGEFLNGVAWGLAIGVLNA